MKLILIAIFALIIATGLAYQVHLDPGYALLTYGEFSIETSLAVFLFMIFIVFISFYIGLRALLTVKQAPKNLSVWNKKRKQARSTKALNNGFFDSTEGNWQRSEKSLIKYAKQSETPLLNYLSAAHAAQSQGAYNRRDDYLFKAGEALPDKIHAIHLTWAKLQLSAGQAEQALASLQQLRTATPGHPVVLTLLMKAHLGLKDWDALYKLLPTIKNNRKIPKQEWQSIEQQTLVNLLNVQVGHLLNSLWKALDKKQKLNPQYLVPYTTQLLKSAKDSLAEEPLIKAINAEFNLQLLGLYCKLDIDASKKIKQLNKWLKNYSNNTSLLNATAQLYLEQAELNSAKELVEQSIALTPTSVAYLLLGKIHEQQPESTAKAHDCYKQGLELSLNDNAGALK